MKLQYAAIGLSLGTFVSCLWIVGDVGRRLNAIEDRVAMAEVNQRDDRNYIRICLDSINELANPGSSITVENTVPEVRK